MNTDSYKCSWILPQYILDDIENEKKKEELSKYRSHYIYLDIPSDIENKEEYVVSKVKQVLINLGYPEKNIHINAKRGINMKNGNIEYKITEDEETKIKNKLDSVKNNHSATSIGTLKSSIGYTTEQLMRGDHLKMKSESKDDIIDYSNIDPDKVELVKQIDKLKVENIDLKHAVEYYEMYVDWLESNYIFILKSPGQLKDAFNRMVGEKNE